MIKCEVFLARSASYDEVRSPHKTWLFAAFHHCHFSSLGATGFVLSQEGDIRPPFFVYGKAGALPLATPLGSRDAVSRSASLLKKA